MNNLKSEFEIVRNHAILLSYEWKFYNDLYAKQENVEILNESASYFFYTLQLMYLDSIILKIARLLETKKNGSNENLNIEYLISKMKLENELGDMLKNIREEFNAVKPYRNKNIAHIDKNTQLNSVNHLPNDIYELLKKVLGSLFILMNKINLSLNGSSVLYELASAENSTNALLMNLMRAARYKNLLKEEIIDRNDFVINSTHWKKKKQLNTIPRPASQ